MVNVVQTNTNNVLNVDGNGNITGTPGVIRPSLPDDFGITLNAIDANPVAGIVNAAAPAINPLDLFEIDLSLVDAANPGTFPFEGVDGVAYDDTHFVTTKNMADINYRDNKFYELLADMFFRLVASKGDWGKVTRDDGTSYVGTSNNDVSFFFDAPNGQEKQIAWDVETGTVTIAGQQLELGQQAEFDAVIDGQAGKATVALFRDPADNKIKAEIQFGDVGIQLIQEHLDNGLVFTNVQTDTDKVKHELSGIIGELNSAAVTIQNHKTDANNDGTSDEAEWIRDKYELNRIDEKKQTLVEDAAAKAQQVAQKTDDIQVNRWTSASIAQSNGTAADTPAKAATPAPKPAPAPVPAPVAAPKPAV
ncbi:MAG: hypothetical protein KC462_04750, partial [Cyanobacteria bacterium HKST-UBA05]|nr:hypothetical protein [Cyanobacteria bacterium HKST-UBA05]